MIDKCTRDIVVRGWRQIARDQRAIAQDPDSIRNHCVAMNMQVQAGAETLHGDDRARVNFLAARQALRACASTQGALDASNHDFLQRGNQRWMLHQHDANGPGERQRPLAITRNGQHIVDQMSRDISHAAPGA